MKTNFLQLNPSKPNHPKGRLITNLKKDSDETKVTYNNYKKAGQELGLKVEMLDDAYCIEGKLVSSLCAIVITSDFPTNLSAFHEKYREYRAFADG